MGDKLIKSGMRGTIKGAAKGVSIGAKGAEFASSGVAKVLGKPKEIAGKKIAPAVRGAQGIGLASLLLPDAGAVASTIGTYSLVETLANLAKVTSREVAEVSEGYLPSQVRTTDSYFDCPQTRVSLRQQENLRHECTK